MFYHLLINNTQNHLEIPENRILVKNIYLCHWCRNIVTKNYIYGKEKKGKWDSVKEIETHIFTFDYINNNKDVIYNLGNNY